jgi:Protein tyrosine and serine/threonine kinase
MLGMGATAYVLSGTLGETRVVAKVAKVATRVEEIALELQLMSALDHPHFMSAYGGSLHPIAVAVLPLMGGGDLLAAQEQLTTAQRYQVLLDVTEGME